MKKRVCKVVVSLVIVGVLLFLAQRLLVPKYVDDIREGALIQEYYDEKNDHDVIFIGDCEVYENFSPIEMWEKYGITSYIRGSASQVIWQSYYLLEETISIEKPKVVVFNVLAMNTGSPVSEAYNRMTLDGMKLSKHKIDAINVSMMKDESLISYIFPLLRYHSRWSEINESDFKYMFSTKKISHNGYLMRSDVLPVTSIPDPKVLGDYQFADICYEYLDKMTKLCKDNGIELVLVKAPSLFPAWYDEYEAQIEEYAKKNNLSYYNFLEVKDLIGLDYTKDTYDKGLHLNNAGAIKLSDYFGKILSEKFQLTDHRNDEKYKADWQEKVDFYNEMLADQQRELKEYGYLKSYGAKAPETNN